MWTWSGFIEQCKWANQVYKENSSTHKFYQSIEVFKIHHLSYWESLWWSCKNFICNAITIIADSMFVKKSNKGNLDRSIPCHVSCANYNPWGGDGNVILSKTSSKHCELGKTLELSRRKHNWKYWNWVNKDEIVISN
jgi:hypothetical protein